MDVAWTVFPSSRLSIDAEAAFAVAIMWRKAHFDSGSKEQSVLPEFKSGDMSHIAAFVRDAFAGEWL